MLAWLYIALGISIWALFAAWLDWRALRDGLAQMRRELPPGHCPYCALKEHYRRFHDEPAPAMLRHRCHDRPGDLMPAARNGSEVEPAEGKKC